MAAPLEDFERMASRYGNTDGLRYLRLLEAVSHLYGAHPGVLATGDWVPSWDGDSCVLTSERHLETFRGPTFDACLELAEAWARERAAELVKSARKRLDDDTARGRQVEAILARPLK